jgi:hypothetical protein
MSNKFDAIGYSDIDLHKTEALLKSQGLLYVELSSFRAKTMIILLNIEKRFKSNEYKKLSKPQRLIEGLWDILRVTPLTLISSNLVMLHCIYVNNCTNSDWEKLQNGNYRFTLS